MPLPCRGSTGRFNLFDAGALVWRKPLGQQAFCSPIRPNWFGKVFAERELGRDGDGMSTGLEVSSKGEHMRGAVSVEKDDDFREESVRADFAEVNTGRCLTSLHLNKLPSERGIFVVYRDIANNVHACHAVEVGRHGENVLVSDLLIRGAEIPCSVETLRQHQCLAGLVGFVVEVNVPTDDGSDGFSVRQNATFQRSEAIIDGSTISVTMHTSEGRIGAVMGGQRQASRSS